MSKNWSKDIKDMHNKYNVHAKVNQMDKKMLREFLKFRVSFLAEEYNELCAAVDSTSIDAEETVDALVDLCVVALGTLDLFGVDADRAWDEVLKANMDKEVGIKASRPNVFGLPDLIKPTFDYHGRDWNPPSHAGNHGLLADL